MSGLQQTAYEELEKVLADIDAGTFGIGDTFDVDALQLALEDAVFELG